MVRPEHHEGAVWWSHPREPGEQSGQRVGACEEAGPVRGHDAGYLELHYVRRNKLLSVRHSCKHYTMGIHFLPMSCWLTFCEKKLFFIGHGLGRHGESARAPYTTKQTSYFLYSYSINHSYIYI